MVETLVVVTAASMALRLVDKKADLSTVKMVVE